MSVKTPVTILQELSVKNGTIPLFDYLDQNSNGFFQCKVTALNVEAIGDGRCKKDAKQEAARVLLKKLAEQGKYFPSTCDNLTVPNTTPQAQDALLNSVALLTDFCSNFKISPPEFELLQDTGPPHAKEFTVQCKVGGLERVATALSKKLAKQKAASIVLEYFKENMAEKVLEFVQSQDTNAVDKNNFAAEKYMELSESPWKPNLGYIIANYHYGLKELEEDILKEAKEFFSTLSIGLQPSPSNINDIEKLLHLLKLDFEWEPTESNNSSTIVLLKIPHSIPPIYIDGIAMSTDTAKYKCAHKALVYFKQMLYFT